MTFLNGVDSFPNTEFKKLTHNQTSGIVKVYEKEIPPSNPI